MKTPIQNEGAAMKIPMKLFGSFRPADWAEEDYISHPPFVAHALSGQLLLVPRDPRVDETVRSLASVLGLKTGNRDPRSNVVTRPHPAQGLKEFDWFVRRSWKDGELSTLWALAYLGEREDWSKGDSRLEEVAEAAGISPDECKRALEKLFHLSGGAARNLEEFASDKSLIRQNLDRKIAELPIWTEETIMSALCALPEGSVSELHEAMLAQGLGIAAVYKVSERLKTGRYVYTQRHRRVNKRGPMREMLAADCSNCFFGYSNSETCLADSLRQITSLLERDYGTEVTKGKKAALLGGVKSVPYACRTNRRVLNYLRLAHEMERTAEDEGVMSVLRMIEEGYGVNLPTKMPDGGSNVAGACSP